MVGSQAGLDNRGCSKKLDSATSSLSGLAQAADFQALVFVFVFRDNDIYLMGSCSQLNKSKLTYA